MIQWQGDAVVATQPLSAIIEIEIGEPEIGDHVRCVETAQQRFMAAFIWLVNSSSHAMESTAPDPGGGP